VLRGCSAAEVFDLFHLPGLATHRHRHHSLAALPQDDFAQRVSPIELVRMYKLYSMQRSGNSYKVRLALALLNAPYRAIEVDILRGESRTPDFLAMNPSGQVPLLEVAEGR
jgi:glutathione S-transferase